jgi:hypothetical protein
MEIDFAYFNYEHGGLVDGRDHFFSSGRGYDFGGLIRVAGSGGRWPNVLVLGEGDRYEMAGGEGMWGAVTAMHRAGGPAYTPLACELPKEGLYAPVIFVDQQVIEIRRFYDHRLPDHPARYSNLLVATLPGRPWSEKFLIKTGHGALDGGDSRLADAMRLRRLADPGTPSIVAMDWNSVPSGPMWEDTALRNPGDWGPGAAWNLAHRVAWDPRRGLQWPLEADTRALDYLIGVWDPQTRQRAGGIGFYDVAELAQDPTPTQAPSPEGYPRRTIDRILVNAAWKDKIVPGSYQVHQPDDPDRPDSDHLRVSVAIRI